MKARLLPLLAVLVTGLLLVHGFATPRGAQVIPSGTDTGLVAGAAETDPALLGAPQSRGQGEPATGGSCPDASSRETGDKGPAETLSVASSEETRQASPAECDLATGSGKLGGGAPHPTSGTIPVAVAWNPELTPEPTPKPRLITGGIGGWATWWFSFGHGLYAAIRPDLGTKGDLAIVCGGKPYHCLSLPVTTTCACLGPGSDRLIDLSRDAFESFADPSVGTVRIVLQVVHQP